MTEPFRVRDPDGREATITSRSPYDALLLLRADDGREAWIDPGLVQGERLAAPLESLLKEGGTIPVVEERLVVGARLEETGVVRVRKETVERPETVRLDTVRETVEVERVPVGRVVEAPPVVRQEGDVTIVPVLEERTFVETRLVLVEEIRITLRRETTTEERTVILRRDEVTVERDAPTS